MCLFISWYVSQLHEAYCLLVYLLSKEILIPYPKIKDQPTVTHTFHYILFADDTNVFISDKSVESLFERANHELTTISSWFRANKLSLNIDKTKFILFRSRRKLLPAYNYRLTIDGKQIMQTESCKFLGVYLDQHRTWKEHITQISKKLAKNSSILTLSRI